MEREKRKDRKMKGMGIIIIYLSGMVMLGIFLGF